MFARLIGMAAFLTVGLAWAVESFVALDPQQTYIQAHFSKGLPVIDFYEAPDMTGKPVLRLDEKGVFESAKQLCSWPGGRFAIERQADMVLERQPNPGRPPQARAMRDACPSNLPIVSTYGDRGRGTAVLYFRVTKIQDSIAQTMYRDRKLYFSMKPFGRSGFFMVKPTQRGITD